ncbi:site-specific integrase [Pseudoflavonifractor sp. 524-17]|uniref:tyrosine-type recombinase/integrase n=1 Tax=Pseudoflavonifractor sp. 524-17 TaxID=2304577 RepID=UPI00137B5FBF|nr:site-specific integrase [Pseudoflavonifractor sp. 524-17]NCE63566.1 site-specific integrase [Pseudoflavonifractor sp. 524-17]
MASIKKEYDATGAVVYKVQASGGRGRKVKRSWRPEPGWSARTIERELNKFAAQLENELADGTISTKKEDEEKARLAALENAKLKTLRQYATGVFMPTKEATFSENSRSSYQRNLDVHILPVLGDFLMVDITPAMLSKLLLDFQKNGHAHASAVKLYNILNGIFQMAFLDDTIKTNPMLKVKRPSPRKEEKAQDESEKAYTVQQLAYILQCLENESLKWQTYINLVADTGIRRGEACGLEWADIDWAKGTITIRRNAQYTPTAGVYVTNPKNGKSRTVDVGPDVLKLLQQLRLEQAGKAISRYVFTQDSSPDIMHPQSPTRYFKKFGQRYGIEDFHPHKLRHTSASLALTNGADVVSVSERLGHSDTSVTLRMYAHANEESIRRAGQVVRDALKAQA